MRDGAPAVGLAELVAEVRALAAEVRELSRRMTRSAQPDELLAAIDDELGDARFTARGLLELAADEPRGALAAALAAAIDMRAAEHARATALGALLAKLPGVEAVARQRGVAVYRLRA